MTITFLIYYRAGNCKVSFTLRNASTRVKKIINKFIAYVSQSKRMLIIGIHEIKYMFLNMNANSNFYNKRSEQ